MDQVAAREVRDLLQQIDEVKQELAAIDCNALCNFCLVTKHLQVFNRGECFRLSYDDLQCLITNRKKKLDDLHIKLSKL